jgi:hypothetical protein
LEKPVKPGFSPKFKEAVPKAEVLEQPRMTSFKGGIRDRKN